MIALAVSALITAYLLVPYALFRFIFGRFVPLRLFQERKTEDITRAVVTLAVVYAPLYGQCGAGRAAGATPLAFLIPQTFERRTTKPSPAGCIVRPSSRNTSTSFGMPFGEVLNAREDSSVGTTSSSFRLLSLVGLRNQVLRQAQAKQVFTWVADLYLLPHISQWYVSLLRSLSDKRTTVKADILMTDNTLYSGDVAEHFIDKEGNLSGLFLATPQRFDRRAYLREQDAWGSTRSAASFWRQSQAPNLYLLADKIVNLNLNYHPPLGHNRQRRYRQEVCVRKGHSEKCPVHNHHNRAQRVGCNKLIRHPVSSEFEPLQFDAIGTNVRKIVVRLLREPAFGAPAEDLRQPNGHFGRNPALAVHQFRQVVRVTPSAAAASVMVKPKGSMHWRSTTPPGWGGFFIGMSSLPPLIEIINVIQLAAPSLAAGRSLSRSRDSADPAPRESMS